MLSSFVSAEDWYKQESSSTGRNLNSVYAVNENLLFAVGSDQGYSTGTIIRAQDGETWATRFVHSTALYGICASSSNNIIAVGGLDVELEPEEGPTILLSENGGTDWNQKQPGVSEGSLKDVYCIGSTVYAIGGLASQPDGSAIQGIILKSTNSGRTWNQLLSGTSQSLEGIHFVDSSHGYIVGSGGVILKTVTGTSFQTAATIRRGASPVNFKNIFCLDMDKCWAVGNGDIVYKTIDGWENWEAQDTGDIVSGMRSVYFIDENNGWVVGQNQIRSTENGGEDWSVDMADISSSSGQMWNVNRVNDLAFAGSYGWAVGDVYNIEGGAEGLERGTGVILRHELEEPLEDPVDPIPAYEVDDTEEPVLADIVCPALMIECDLGWNPVFEYEGGCPISYICEREIDCIPEFSECLQEVSRLVNSCVDSASREECLEQYSTNRQECIDAFNECAGLDDSDEGNAGISPNSFFWRFDKFFEQVNVLFTVNKVKKAEKRLEIAKERMLEIKTMVAKNKLNAAEKAKAEHEKMLNKVKDAVDKIEKDDSKNIEKISKLTDKLDKYVGHLNKNMVELKIEEKLSKEQKKILDSLKSGAETSFEKIKSNIKEKKSKMNEKLGKVGEEEFSGTPKEKAYQTLQLAESELKMFKNKLESYDKKYWENSYGLLQKAEGEFKRAEKYYEGQDWKTARDYASSSRKILSLAIVELKEGLSKFKKEDDKAQFENEEKERKAAWEVYSLAKDEFDAMLVKTGLGSQPWKQGDELGELYFETVGYLNKANAAYIADDYEKSKEYAELVKKTIIKIFAVFNNKGEEPTKTSCYDYCSKGVYFFSGSYNSKTAECEYSQKNCDQDCDTGGKKCAEVIKKDCPAYCSKGIYFFSGVYNIKTGECEYSQKNCGNDCNSAGTKCAEVLKKDCPAYCSKGVYFYSGVYNVKTGECGYSKKTCEQGCNKEETKCAALLVK